VHGGIVPKNKAQALLLAVALGLEVINPGAEERPHTEKEIILAPEPTGAEADALAPFATPPENPWLSSFTLRVTQPEALEGFWVNTNPTHTGGYVSVLRTQTCQEFRFNETAVLHNPNTNQDIETRVYLNEDYVITMRTRKLCEQLQEWLLQRGITTQLLLQVDNKVSSPPDYRSLASNYAPVYDDVAGPKKA
jgi:hypothetical protein